jgi:lysophospholipase L1-like esterase
MRLSLLFGSLLIFILYCSFMENRTYTLLCLGDSYTIGEAVDEQKRFPMQAVALLKKEGLQFSTPEIIAKTGWTTDELAIAIKEKNLRKKFDFVTLLIGVNNQYRGRDAANYRKEFRDLLNTAIEFADGNANHVFVLSIPDWGVTPFGNKDLRGEKTIGLEIEFFNAINKEETLKAKARYIDITPVSKEAKNKPALLAFDGLHPSGEMYQYWANLLAEDMRKAIAPAKNKN